MFNAVSALISELLGVILPAWLECDAVKYILGLLVFALVVDILRDFLRL